MGVTYKKLWKLLIDKNITKVQLRDMTEMGPNTLAKMGKDQRVSLEVLEKICKTLDCNFSDIIDYVKDDENGNKWICFKLKKHPILFIGTKIWFEMEWLLFMNLIILLGIWFVKIRVYITPLAVIWFYFNLSLYDGITNF